MQLFQLRYVVHEQIRAKRKSRLPARKAAGNRLQINEFSKRFPAAFRTRIRLKVEYERERLAGNR
jgi:hypothetical protein